MRWCPICDSKDGPQSLLGSLAQTGRHKLSRTEFDFLHCSACDLLYLSPAPTAEDLSAMYANAIQFGEGSIVQQPGHARMAHEFISICARAILRAQGKDASTIMSVLEIGAGVARLCRVAKELNSQSRTVAQDVSSECVATTPWVDHYLVGSAEDPQLDAWGRYDIISMIHVLEHIVDPLATLRRCRELLCNEGTTFITAPHRPVGWTVGDPLDAWRSYSYNHVPLHVQYFSEQAMRKAAERSGLRLLRWDQSHEGGQACEAWLGHLV